MHRGPPRRTVPSEDAGWLAAPSLGAPDAREMPPNPATAPEPPAKASEILPAREVAPPPLEIHAESAREEKAVGEVLAKASEGDART